MTGEYYIIWSLVYTYTLLNTMVLPILYKMGMHVCLDKIRELPNFFHDSRYKMNSFSLQN